MLPVLERGKTVHASYRAATVIGKGSYYHKNFRIIVIVCPWTPNAKVMYVTTFVVPYFAPYQKYYESK
jgi:hypothetical protein